MGSFCRGMSWSVLLLTCGVNAMNMEMNLEKCRLMIRDTHPFTAIEVYNEEVMNAYGGSDLPINWKVIEKVAVEGDPMAQYCHAEHCLAIARTLFNGERKAKKKEAYVFMLLPELFTRVAVIV